MIDKLAFGELAIIDVIGFRTNVGCGILADATGMIDGAREPAFVDIGVTSVAGLAGMSRTAGDVSTAGLAGMSGTAGDVSTAGFVGMSEMAGDVSTVGFAGVSDTAFVLMARSAGFGLVVETDVPASTFGVIVLGDCVET